MALSVSKCLVKEVAAKQGVLLLFYCYLFLFIHLVKWSVYSLVWFFDSAPSHVTTSTQGGCVHHQQIKTHTRVRAHAHTNNIPHIKQVLNSQ